MEFKQGEEILYKGKETFIEEIFSDGTAKIANPAWDWDEEGEYVEMDEEYDVPYWISVSLEDLEKK